MNKLFAAAAATLAALSLSLAVPAFGQSGEANVRKALEAKFGPVESLTKTNYLGGLYEAYVEGRIVYTDEKASVFIVGHLVDPKSLQSITEARLQKLSAVKIADLPLDNAIKQVRGDGKRIMVTFEDPNCGYCKRLARDLTKINNVTVYTFLVPILGEDSLVKSQQIWCAADKAKAWNDWMVDNKTPSGKTDCSTPLNKNIDVARKLRIESTPTLVMADGERVRGAIPLAQIEQKLGK